MGLLSADEAFFYLISYLSSLWNVGQKLNVTMPTRPDAEPKEDGGRVVTLVTDARRVSFVPPCARRRRRRRWLISRHRRLNRRRRRRDDDDDDGAGPMEAMKTREGCEEEDWTLVCRVPRMKEDDDDVNDNDEETTMTMTMTCVWLRDQRLRWTSFSPGRRAPNVRVGR